MKRFLHFLLLVLCPLLLRAQNWKTVTTDSITYFSGGSFADERNRTDSNQLRMIMVDSFSVANGDSTFYFFPNVRDTNAYYYNNGACLDTTAASWQGHLFIHKADGTDYFFNSFNDTIIIKTLAQQGDSWPLATDTSGTVLKGTISQVGIITVDGVTDSFKTITIQAIKNGVPVANYYNNLIFQLSKNHGWLRALDMYGFPNIDTTIPSDGTTTYAGQSVRLNNSFANLNINYIDLVKKYAPGNEWIYNEYATINMLLENVYYDSVISATPLSANSIIVQLKTEECDVTYPQYQQPLKTVHTTYHTDTVVNNTAALIIKKNIYPELNSTEIFRSGATDNFYTHYFVDTQCGAYIFTTDDYSRSYLQFNNGCWSATPTDQGYIHTTTLYGFGQTNYYHLFGEDGYPVVFYNETDYSYIQLGGCTTGTKTNVLALNVPEVQNNPTSFTIYPNPAQDKVYVQSSAADPKASITLYDIVGRTILQQQMTGTTTMLSIAGMAPGIYLISVKNENSSHTFKLQIQ